MKKLKQGIVTQSELLELVSLCKNTGESIVVTNGCFDILHKGHIYSLQEAKKYGDRLIVLVNSDASVKRLKGPERPVNSLEDRMYLLSELKSVDWVTSFDEDTPANLICKIIPDVLVKGGDYGRNQLSEYNCVIENSGIIILTELLVGRSTTSTIDKIKKKIVSVKNKVLLDQI